MPSTPSLATLARINHLLPGLVGACERWHLAGLRLFLQRYYYCIVEASDYFVGSHVHDWFELSQLVAGRVEYSDAAKAQILGPGEIFFMAPGHTHRWRVVQAPVVISSFQLRISPLNDEGRRIADALDELSHGGTFRLKRIPELARLSETWTGQLASRPAGGFLVERLRAWFHLYHTGFFEAAIGATLSAGPAAPVGDTEEFRRSSSQNITEFVQQNLHKPIRLDDISSHFHYSGRHINRIFQRDHGVALGRYILEQKLQAAQQLLASTGDSVKQVANRLGYLDGSYFCRIFRKQFGVTPTEYRDRLHPSPATKSLSE